MEDIQPIGSIARIHGFKGNVYVKLDVEVLEVYEEIKWLFLEHNKKPVPYFVEFIRVFADKILVKIEDVNNEIDANKLIGCKVFVNLGKLQIQDEIKDEDFMGYRVIDEEIGEIGEIIEIFNIASNRLAKVFYNKKRSP